MTRMFVSMTLVLSMIAIAPRASGHDFNWDNLAFASIKFNPEFDIDANVDWYIEEYRPDIWKKYRNDEFVYREKWEESRELLKQRIAQFKLDEIFIIRGTVKIGEYNFDKQEFPTSPSGPTAYYYEHSSKSSDVIPGYLRVFFNNHEFLRAIPMDRNVAKNLITSRKNSSGYINREIYLTIEMRLVTLERAGELKAEALNVTYFSDSARTRPIVPKLIWTPPQEQASEATEKSEPPASTANDLRVVTSP